MSVQQLEQSMTRYLQSLSKLSESLIKLCGDSQELSKSVMLDSVDLFKTQD